MRYFINIQTDGPVRSDLFQHRLWLPPPPPNQDDPHQWSDVFIAFRDFTLTNSGDLSETQIEMLRSRVRTIGISVLGPKEGRFVSPIHHFDFLLEKLTLLFFAFRTPSRYELGIEAIDAVSLDPSQKSKADLEKEVD